MPNKKSKKEKRREKQEFRDEYETDSQRADRKIGKWFKKNGF